MKRSLITIVLLTILTLTAESITKEEWEKAGISTQDEESPTATPMLTSNDIENARNAYNAPSEIGAAARLYQKKMAAYNRYLYLMQESAWGDVDPEDLETALKKYQDADKEYKKHTLQDDPSVDEKPSGRPPKQ